MQSGFRLGRIMGLPVAVNPSVLVVVLLLAWGLAEGVLPSTAPGHPAWVYWTAGVAGALLLICSLLAHEVAHAVVARRAGVEVEGLTLWMFGGVATLRGEAPNPGADFRIAAVGPAVSFLAALLFGVAAVVLAALGSGDLVVGVATWLAGINVVLAVFNLIPGAPLDGGRILRAALWKRSGDRDRAATTATGVGQAVAYGLVVLGVVALLYGDVVGGLWTMMIGWFLLSAARAEQDATVVQHSLKDVPVHAVMTRDVQVGDADLSVAAFIDDLVLRGRHSSYPVVDRHGTVIGLVTLAQLRAVPAHQRAGTRVGDVTLPLAHVARCTPETPVTELLEQLTPESGRRALVFDGDRLVGLVTPADVTHALEARALVTGR